MVLKRRDGDLCKAYRPLTFSDIVGQNAIIKSIRSSLLSENHSQCYLLHGQSGCGKTTTARVMAMSLNCTDRSDNGDPCCECENCVNISLDTHPDFKEINAADTGGKDQIRQIQKDLKTRPMFGKVKLYILDEAHKMTSAAQEALLKGTEDMSKGVYVILCSTEPKKIIATLRNRCEDYNFKLLSNSDIKNLVEIVGLQEGYTVPPKVLNAIISVSTGMPRNALKSLQKALNLSDESEEDILSTISFIDELEPKVIDLCLMIHGRKKSTWADVIKKYKSLNIEPQQVNLVLAGWFRSSLERATPAGNSTSFNYSHKLSKALSYFCEDLPIIKPENKIILNMYKAYEEFYRG